MKVVIGLGMIAASMAGSVRKTPQYTLVDGDDFSIIDGDLDINEFIKLNELHPEEILELQMMRPGQTMMFGGGAAGLFFVRRVS